MNLLRKVFFQLINKKLRRMKQMHDDDSVVLRRKNKKIAADSSGLGDRRRLSWSISDLSRLPAVRTSSTLVKTRCSRVRNTSISSCSLSSGWNIMTEVIFQPEYNSRLLQFLYPK